jgi:tyrosinase
VQKKGSILAPGVADGSKTLFDDFVYVHMNATLGIHFTVSYSSPTKRVKSN